MTVKIVTCPKGWTLPSATQIGSLSGESGSSMYVSDFSPVLGGNYTNGTLNGESTRGRFLGFIMYDGARRYSLNYSGGNLYTGNCSRSDAFYICCVQAS